MIPINEPLISEEERVEVMRVLDSGRLTDSSLEGGFMVKEFEKIFANFVGVKYAVAVNSGTSALLASLLSLDVGYGDEVLMPSFTFVATANAVLVAGARPVFVDIDLNDYTIDISDLERKINKRCKAVIPVHLYGHPANMDPIIELAREHDLFVIEDAAQSLGASYKGRQTGAIGDLGCFSFYPTKVITCGEGGAITTDDEDLYIKLKMVRNHGIVNDYNSEVLGLNLRMPEIGAALIKAQMKRINSFLEVRRKNAERLSESLDGLEGMKLPREKEGCVHNWYLYTIFVEKNRDEVLESLNKRGVGATAYYRTPVHKTDLYTRLGYGNISLPNTILASEHVASLPVHPGLADSDLSVITSSIREAIKTNF
ncbi:MAG: DegT/DnrJ/EryC1/StrS family aminotransferase [archaeon]|nr:DegT/DnrJ/EryC1/StrS family aminotransferase [archaeon]MCP8305808.1 DegT/DnrJ/EryC1/StrS family aminotransferase [archaeon]